jgi:hypothetical protein
MRRSPKGHGPRVVFGLRFFVSRLSSLVFRFPCWIAVGGLPAAETRGSVRKPLGGLRASERVLPSLTCGRRAGDEGRSSARTVPEPDQSWGCAGWCCDRARPAAALTPPLSRTREREMIRTGPVPAIGHSESGGFAPANPYNAAPSRRRALLLACSPARLVTVTPSDRAPLYCLRNGLPR